MKVYVDQDLCISCGVCVNTCSSVFDWNEEGLAEEQVDEVPEELEEEVREAIDTCPTDAILEKDESGSQDIAMKKD